MGALPGPDSCTTVSTAGGLKLSSAVLEGTATTRGGPSAGASVEGAAHATPAAPSTSAIIRRSARSVPAQIWFSGSTLCGAGCRGQRALALSPAAVAGA